jgi:single-strand DNA-binding protein
MRRRCWRISGPCRSFGQTGDDVPSIPGALTHQPWELAIPGVCTSSFQPFSVGLGFRAIPALGGFTQQFQPCGFRFLAQIAGCAFSKSTNNLFRTLRKTASLALRAGPLRSGSPQQIRARKEDKYMLCKNRITLIGFLGQDAEMRSTPNGTATTRFSLATSVSWKEKGNNEYQTRTEWHRILCWNKLAEWAGALQKSACVEVEGELRYREYTPADSDRSVRVAEIHATSILALDRSSRQPASVATVLEISDEPLD